MFNTNTYRAGDTNLKINACSGGIYKTYRKWDLKNEKNAKEVIVLQMIICGEMEIIAEIIYKDDFERELKSNNK